MDDSRQSKGDERPIDRESLTKIGTVRAGEAPRKRGVNSLATMLAGYVASFFVSDIVRETVGEVAKEDWSKYNKKTGGFWAGIGNGFKQVVDPKLWRSNLASMSVLVGGLLLTDYAVKKVEQNNFTKAHGEWPPTDRTRDIQSHPSMKQTSISDVTREGAIDHSPQHRVTR